MYEALIVMPDGRIFTSGEQPSIVLLTLWLTENVAECENVPDTAKIITFHWNFASTLPTT